MRRPASFCPRAAEQYITTPPEAQGVVIGDNGEFIYATSHGRGNTGALIRAARDGQEIAKTDLPNMAEGLALVNGRIVTTYESGAEKYSEDNGPGLDFGSWDDDEALWLSAQMTLTPLSELGLTSGEVEADTESMLSAGGGIFDVAAAIIAQAKAIEAAWIVASMFGGVPAGGVLARRLTRLVDKTSGQLRRGGELSEHAGENLKLSARSVEATDEHSRSRQAVLGRTLRAD